jgi:peptidoglycan hydrolase-like protein with peptidoglycan-binding domain
MTKKIPAITTLLLVGSLFSHAATTQTKHPTATKSPTKSAASHSTTAGSKGKSGKRSRYRKLRGQQAIEPERVKQIQEALIKAHYLTGEADGNWDEHTVAAMQKFQADNNWQTKLMPDSRALIKLGLGPDYSDAINAKNSTFAPIQPVAAPQDPGFVSASGISR